MSNKDLLLGMPIGTAAGRLRKLVMFELVKRLGLNVCFRCSKPIGTAATLSIEHKGFVAAFGRSGRQLL